MIIAVTEANIAAAAVVHSASWQDSHRAFCGPDFIAAHTPERQEEYLRSELKQGKKLYLLLEGRPVGLVSVQGNLIENLYVLPEEQRKGYGTQLLLFAVGQCGGEPVLWVLSNNRKARALYTKHGFRDTGESRVLSETLSEIEMRKSR